MPRFALPAAVLAACLMSAPAAAQMNKCVSPDGTITFQTKACGSQGSGGATTLAASRDVSARAVVDREEAQRRDRCRSAMEIADRQRALLASDAPINRKAASDELAIQERRMRQDGCSAI